MPSTRPPEKPPETCDNSRYPGLDLDSDDEALNNKDNEIEMLKLTIEEQKTIIAQLRAELAERTENTELGENQARKRKRDEEANEVMNVALITDSHDKDIKIKLLTEELNTVKQQVATNAKNKNKPQSEDKGTEMKASRALPVVNPAAAMESLQTNIIEKIKDAIGSQIEVTVDKILQKKLGSTKTYANATSKSDDPIRSSTVNDFRSIMLATKNEELVEERDRSFRESNLIIHGVEESKTVNDTDFVNNLIKNVRCDGVTVKSIARLGSENSDKRRPIKVSLKNGNEKEQVMGNLVNLKGNDMYKKVSITEDYTVSERKMIQEMRERVKEKNNQEPEDSEFVYKLRGTPKNGLMIRRMKKFKDEKLSTNAETTDAMEV